MTDEPPKRVRNHKRRRLWISLGAWLVFLTWFSHFAYIRITTPPAALAYSPKLNDHPADSCLKEIIERTHAMPAAPPSNNNAAFNYCRSTRNALGAGLFGAWSPDPNSNQANAVAFLSGANIEQNLNRIAKLCRRYEPYLRNSTSFSYDSSNLLDPRTVDRRRREIVAAFVFRARYLHSTKGDSSGALADLRTATMLEKIFRQIAAKHDFYRRRTPEICLYELGRTAVEVDIPPALAQEMIRFLGDTLAFSVVDAVKSHCRANLDVETLLDQYYTRDSNGDGWLVLNASAEPLTRYFGVVTEPRSSVWNLFSPLFYSRRTVRDMLLGIDDDYEKLDGLDFFSAQRALPKLLKSEHVPDICNGPMLSDFQTFNYYSMADAFMTVSHHRAVVIMLALSAYKHVHGGYPEKLDALTPDFIEVLYEDPYSRDPFQYYRLSPDRYGLESTSSSYNFRPWLIPNWAYKPPSYIPRREPPQELAVSADNGEDNPEDDDAMNDKPSP